MKTPGYWKNKGFYARLLLPVGMLYSAATAFRFKLKQPRKVPVPVICIGNLTAGGTGKTPTAAAIANLLKKGGYKPASSGKIHFAGRYAWSGKSGINSWLCRLITYPEYWCLWRRITASLRLC